MGLGGYIFTGILLLALGAAVAALVWRGRGTRSVGGRSGRRHDAGVEEARAYSQLHSHQANNFGPF